MNSTSRTSKLLIVAVGLLLFPCVSMGANESYPKNYAEIKMELEVYVNADDMMDEKLLVDREKVRSHGEEAVAALIILFKESADDHYRAAVVDALRHNRGNKKASVDFLAAELKAVPAEWKGELWVAAAIDFLAAANPAEGRTVALNGLESVSDYVKRSSIRTLATVGKAEDVAKLKALSQKREANAEVAKAAYAAAIEIDARTAPR